MTQANLAQALQVTCQAVSKWERGQNAPDITLVPQLTRLLGVSADWLLCSNDNADDSATGAVLDQTQRRRRSGTFRRLDRSAKAPDGVPLAEPTKASGTGF